MTRRKINLIDPSEPLRNLVGDADRLIGLKVGYARVPTTGQDLTAQRDGLAALDVNAVRVFVDHASPARHAAGRSCARPCSVPHRRHAGRDQTRPARALAPRRREIVKELTDRGSPAAARLRARPDDPVGRLLFNVLAMVAEFTPI